MEKEGEGADETKKNVGNTAFCSSALCMFWGQEQLQSETLQTQIVHCFNNVHLFLY